MTKHHNKYKKVFIHFFSIKLIFITDLFHLHFQFHSVYTDKEKYFTVIVAFCHNLHQILNF